MHRLRFESIRITALAGAALAAVFGSAPARADSYDWWLFEQIGLTMNQAKAVATRPEAPPGALRPDADPPAPAGQQAMQRGTGDGGAVESTRPVSAGGASAEKEPQNRSKTISSPVNTGAVSY